jgi:hypothetical protein
MLVVDSFAQSPSCTLSSSGKTFCRSNVGDPTQFKRVVACRDYHGVVLCMQEKDSVLIKLDHDYESVRFPHIEQDRIWHDITINRDVSVVPVGLLLDGEGYPMFIIKDADTIKVIRFRNDKEFWEDAAYEEVF